MGCKIVQPTDMLLTKVYIWEPDVARVEGQSAAHELFLASVISIKPYFFVFDIVFT